MSELYKFTYDALVYLQDNLKKNIDLYRDKGTDFAAILRKAGIDDYRLAVSGVKIRGKIDIKPPESHPSHTADTQALAFYHSLEGMTPRMASNPDILTYLNHMYLHEYGIKRWPSNKGGDSFVRHVQSHWLTKANQPRRIYESSIAGRMWWIAHMSIKAAEASNGAFSAKDALAKFAEYPEYYHRMMQYEILRNPTMRAEYVRLLFNDAKGVNRDGYREIAKELNRDAGARLLDALPQSDIRVMMRNAASRVMRQSKFVRDRKSLHDVKKKKVLSLGAGTQSTVMALMAEKGVEGLEKPDIAIFADTHWEPPYVYRHLDWLEKQLSYDVVRVSAGNIRENILNGVTPTGDKFLDIPVFLINRDGTQSVAARQCTNHYKIRPIRKKLRELLNLQPGRRAPKEIQVEMWLGISADEAHRMKPSRDEWITNRYPLIEMGLTRAQLYNWFQENYPGRELPRSACVGCPYHTNMEWKWLKENDPKSFNDAIFIDRAIRDIPHIRGTLKGEGYLHRERKSLDLIDFENVENYDDFMASECEGLCGV